MEDSVSFLVFKGICNLKKNLLVCICFKSSVNCQLQEIRLWVSLIHHSTPMSQYCTLQIMHAE